MRLRARVLTLCLVSLAVSAAAAKAYGTVIVKVNGETLRSVHKYHSGGDPFAPGGPVNTGPVRFYVLSSESLNTRSGNPDTNRWVALTFRVAPGVRGPAECEGLQFAAPVAGAFDFGGWSGTTCEVRITRNVKRRYRQGSETVTMSRKLAGTFSGTILHQDGTPGAGTLTISGRFRTRLFFSNGGEE
jgi:hypothetical protein